MLSEDQWRELPDEPQMTPAGKGSFASLRMTVQGMPLRLLAEISRLFAIHRQKLKQATARSL